MQWRFPLVCAIFGCHLCLISFLYPPKLGEMAWPYVIATNSKWHVWVQSILLDSCQAIRLADAECSTAC